MQPNPTYNDSLFISAWPMMSRPSRALEALEILRSYYQQNGILPTVEVATELMGYRSPGSTYPVIKSLVADGYLEQEARGGRLKPGRAFDHAQPIKEQPHQLCPVGCKTATVTQPSPAELAVLPGDLLVYDPDAMPTLGDILAVQDGQNVVAQSFSTDTGRPQGFLGVVQLQYRSYAR